jgi:hypothetical protein
MCHGQGVETVPAMTNTTHDRRGWAETLPGISLIAAPLLLLAANAIDPGASDRAAERLPQISHHSARYVAAAYLLVAGAWMFLPGLVALWNLLRGPRTTLGQVGVGLVLIGTVTTIAFFGFGVYEYEAATSGLDPTQAARLVDDTEHAAIAIPLLVVFLVGVVIGSLILAWSLWRRRLVPGWASAAIAVGTVLNLAANGAALSALAWSLQCVGYAPAGMRLLSLRTGDSDDPGRPLTVARAAGASR